MVAEIAALDLWTLFVVYVFGNFWIAVIGLSAVMFVIMGPLGRMSSHSTIWYIMMFLIAMALGYGYTIVSVFLTLYLVYSAYQAWERNTRNQ